METEGKLSDEEFLSFLRANCGLYAKTAKAIREQLGIKYSRQAARDRAEKFKDELEDIREENLDRAEEALYSLLESTDEKIKLQAAQFVLKNIGKERGYTEKHLIDHTSKGEKINTEKPNFTINVIGSGIPKGIE